MTSYVTGAGAVLVLKVLGLMPVASQLGGTIAVPAANSDVFYIDVTSERLPLRLGYWVNAAVAGVFALACSTARSSTNTHFGARPAFIL
jgi:hypothetical protein